jgi:hypothetical protein
MNKGIILATIFGLSIATLVVYLKYYTSQIDWSKQKKIKDPLAKLKKLR